LTAESESEPKSELKIDTQVRLTAKTEPETEPRLTAGSGRKNESKTETPLIAESGRNNETKKESKTRTETEPRAIQNLSNHETAAERQRRSVSVAVTEIAVQSETAAVRLHKRSATAAQMAIEKENDNRRYHAAELKGIVEDVIVPSVRADFARPLLSVE
jgi:hypothetical protein